MTEMERIARKYFEPLEMPVDGEVIDLDYDFRESCKSALREFGELACKAVCYGCRIGLSMQDNGTHHIGDGFTCRALSIRKLMATEIERG